MSFAGLLFAASPALAHAQLLSSDPAPGAVLDTAPTSITLVFTEPIEISLGAIRLFDGAGKQVDIGKATHPAGHTEQVRVALGSLANGSYVVDWRVVSSDSHPVHAAYTFQVGAASTLASGLLDRIVSHKSASTPAEVGLAISRGLVALALAIVFGVLSAVLLGVVSLSSRLRLVTLAASVVGALAGAIALPLEVAYATGQSLGVITDSSAWSSMLNSRVGVAWIVRAAVILVCGVALTLTVSRRASAWWRVLLGAGLFVVGVAAAFGGHGATGRWHIIGIAATAAHLGGMAVWLGGLLAVLVSFANIDDSSVHRFSKVAFVSIVVVVLSGVVQALRQLGSFNALTNTSYGTLLIWKIIAVAALVAIAAVSRQATHGKVLGRVGADSVAIDRPRLVRAIIIEAVLAAAILGVTSLLMAANPTVANGPTTFSQSLVSNNYIVSVVVSPGGVGSNDLHLYITSPTSSTAEPDSVTVEISDPGRSVDPIAIEVSKAGLGHYTTAAAVFPYPAQWTLHISAIYNSFDKVQWTTVVPIR
ncbi:MAG: copper resistance protein CopC [Actinomycetota bacterium]